MTSPRTAFRDDALDVSEDGVGYESYIRVTAWMKPYEPRLYRVVMISDTQLRITPFSATRANLPEIYTLDDDPLWITDRVRALSLLPLPPLEVNEIGMRIDAKTYWIIAPEDA